MELSRNLIYLLLSYKMDRTSHPAFGFKILAIISGFYTLVGALFQFMTMFYCLCLVIFFMIFNQILSNFNFYQDGSHLEQNVNKTSRSLFYKCQHQICRASPWVSYPLHGKAQ